MEQKVKYDYSLLKIDFPNGKPKWNDTIRIICPIHGEFKLTYNAHKNAKIGCAKCKGFKKTTDDIIKEFKLLHGNRYDYSLVKYIGVKEKCIIICSVHGKFKQAVDSHLKGSNCPMCTGKIINNDVVIKNLKTVHGNKYDYSLVNYNSCEKKITIICNDHGKFEQLYSNHLKGQGCPKCGNVNKNKNRKISLNICKEDALNYKNKKEWQVKSRSIYGAAWRNGWLEECCIHMKKPKQYNLFWTKEKCIQDALKYILKKEWRKHSNSAYVSARRNQWLEECCKHMKK